MKTTRFLVMGLLAGAAAAASAQWQWVDRDGRKVFSDRPPPPEIADRSILKQPRGAPAGTAAQAVAPAPAAGAAPAATAVPAPKPGAGKDPELEARKKAAEDAEEAKRKADEERQAKARADNCQRARQAQGTIDSGIRIAQVNAQGERVIMDDAARAAESTRNQAIMASDCR